MKILGLCLLGCCVALLGCHHSDEPVPDSRLTDAEAQAQKENKLVLLDFTGSDWCEWCKVLDGEVFSKKEFSDYAKSNLVMIEVDFPAQKKLPADLAKANDALKDKYNVSVFPTLVLLKPDGTVLWNNPGYSQGGPPAMIAKLEEAKKK
jgi:thioredoxin-related protein